MGTKRIWALPRLAGRTWWVFAAIWSGLLAVCLLSSAMVLPAIWQRVANPVSPSDAVGLAFMPQFGDPTILSVTSTARRAGLRHGDRLRLVDGRPAAGLGTALNAQLAGRAGTRVVLVTETPSGVLGRHVVTRDPRSYRASLAAVGLTPVLHCLMTAGLSYLFEEVLLLGCALVLMVKRSHDPLAPWASLTMLSLLLGDSAAAGWFAAQFGNPTVAYYVINGACFSLLMIVLSVFPTGRSEPRWSLAVAVVGVGLTVATEPLPTAQSNIVSVVTPGAAVVAIAARYRRMLPGLGRQQIRWALLGFAASMVALTLLTLVQFAWQVSGDIGVAAWLLIAGAFFGAAVNGLLVVGVTISLLRWRLYDADATISRSVVYGALTLGLLAVFAGSEKLVELLGEQYFGERPGALAGALGAAAAAVTFVPLHHRVTHWADKRFRSGLVRLREGLPLLVGDMRETATPAALADAMLARVETGVRARHGAVVVAGALLDARDVEPDEVAAWLARANALDDGEEPLRCDRADPLFPMRLRLAADATGPVGWLLLGPRPDGSFYGREEREALREIADPVARALAIAIERERREAKQQQRESDLRRELSVLQQRMDALQLFVLNGHGPNTQEVRFQS